MKKNGKDSIDIISEELDILRKKVKRLEKENRMLRSQKKTLEGAWEKTEDYLISVSNGKTIEQIFKEIGTETKLERIKEICPNCTRRVMNKQQFEGFYMAYCKCGYRNRVYEEGTP